LIKKIAVIILLINSLSYSQLNFQTQNKFYKENLFNTVSHDALLSIDNGLQVLQSPFTFDKTT